MAKHFNLEPWASPLSERYLEKLLARYTGEDQELEVYKHLLYGLRALVYERASDFKIAWATFGAMYLHSQYGDLPSGYGESAAYEFERFLRAPLRSSWDSGWHPQARSQLREVYKLLRGSFYNAASSGRLVQNFKVNLDRQRDKNLQRVPYGRG